MNIVPGIEDVDPKLQIQVYEFRESELTEYVNFV